MQRQYQARIQEGKGSLAVGSIAGREGGRQYNNANRIERRMDRGLCYKASYVARKEGRREAYFQPDNVLYKT